VQAGRSPSLANPFRHALDRCCGGQPDEQTLTLLG
jgi:hypothetical protein